jgi:hypothetical protein
MKHFFTIALAALTLTARAQLPSISPVIGPSSVCSSPAPAKTFSVIGYNVNTYSWSVVPSNGVTISNPTSSLTSIAFAGPGSFYTIQCYGTNTVGSSNVEYRSVQVVQTPQVSFSGGGMFCQGSSTNLSASPTNYAASNTMSYTWSPTTGMGPANTLTVNVSPQVSTVYTLALANGACFFSVTYTVNITSCVGLNKHDAMRNSMSIFPNPSAGNVFFSSDISETVIIYNQSGQVVKKLFIVSNTPAALQDLPSGVYYAVAGSRRVQFIISRE